jgi:membrane-bound lytic murein transglycosylase B
MVLRWMIVLIVGGVVGCGGGDEDRRARQEPAPTPAPTAAAPDPARPLPPGADALAADLEATTAGLNTAIDAWLSAGDPARGGPPADVTALAHRQQQIYVHLGKRPRLARRTTAALPRPLAAAARDNIAARRALGSIRSVVRIRPRIRIGPARPAGWLLRTYRRAQRRFEVGWPLLAAVNFVESAFGRVRNLSVSGARGPMQFMPATWDAYGMGGNVRDPHDAIMGAANYLSASGAPGDEQGALYAYNPSSHYVRAISLYARRIRRDDRAFYAYYAWDVLVRGRRNGRSSR